MIRRARLSFKPNVRPGGRAAAPGNGGVAPAAGKESKPAGPGEESTAPPTGGAGEALPGKESKAEPIEAATPVSNEVASSKTASAPFQRRKRISTLPNLAKPRVSNLVPGGVPPPKPSQVDTLSMPPIIVAPCKNEASCPEKGKVQSPQKAAVPVFSPLGQLATLPEKRTPVPQVPQFSPYKKCVLKQQDVSPAKLVECAQTEEPSPLKERPSQKSCSNEVFEVIKKTTKTKKMITVNLEKERIKRAQKLRDLLKAELRKERKAWKAKHPVISPIAEPEKSKMTMRDFIHFIPLTNPMSSSLEENKSSEKSFPVETQATGIGGKTGSEDDDLDNDDEEDDSQLLAPRVKVAEDGSIILDEESLTVEVSRNKAPIVEGNDPIFERGSTTTYSSFRKNNYSKPWSEPETDMFFLAISMVGTDFTMISQLFPHRERIEIKNKFKREERVNGWRIDKAFREKKEFDFEFFAQLLEKALEAGSKKKRIKQPRKTNTKSRKKQKDKTGAEQSLCDEESVLSEEEGADARTAEKENKRSLEDDECSGVADPVPAKKKRFKRQKENTQEPEKETHESQDDDSTQKAKKKSRKRKVVALDTDDKPERHLLENDRSLKETPPVKRRVQKNKPKYKESEFKDDENDVEFKKSEDFQDDTRVSCKAGEAKSPTEVTDPTCDEESSLILFSEDSIYQSGLDDLTGLQHSLSELNEEVSQASDVCLVTPKVILETEPTNVTQEEMNTPTCDKFDSSDKASDAGNGQPGDQNSEVKPKPKMPEGRRARPAPNLSKAPVKRKMSTEEKSADKQQALSDGIDNEKNKKIVEEEGSSEERQTVKAAKAEDSSNAHDGQKESSVQTTIPVRGRLQRPKPNLPARSLTRREKPVTDSKDIPMEEAEKAADGHKPSKAEDAKTLNMGEAGDSSIADNHRQEGSSTVHVSSPIPKNATSESDLSQAKKPKLDQQSCEKEDTSKEKPSLPVRRRFRPKPNLTRASVKNKSPDIEPEVQPSQATEPVKEISVEQHAQESNSKNSSSMMHLKVDGQNLTEEPTTTPLKRVVSPEGQLQRSKPNLVQAAAKRDEQTSLDEPKDIPEGVASVESSVESKDATSDIPVNDAEIDPQLAKSNGHSVTLEKISNGAAHKTSIDSPQAIPEESLSIVKRGEAMSLKPVRTRFTKPSPNIGRAIMRKEISTTEPKTLVPKKGQETLKEIDDNPELLKTEDVPDTSIAAHGCKEDGHATEEKSAVIKPAQLKRGRPIRPVPNLVKPSAKASSTLQSKTIEDLSSAPTIKNKDHVAATPSPANERRAFNTNSDLSLERICPSDAPQKSACLLESEEDKDSLSEPSSSSQSSSIRNTSTPQRSRFGGRFLRRLSTAPYVSPKSEASSDRHEKALRSVKSSTTKVSKLVSPKSKGKTTLVKIRATQQQEDDEEDADPGIDEENYDLSPDMQNQAPVFVPFSLRSPKPVTAEIEETLEELEIPVDAVDLPISTNQDSARTVFQHVLDPEAQLEKREQCDGSAEAAMTLISMGSSVYQHNIGESFISDQSTENQMLSSPHHDKCATEVGITVDPRTLEDPHCGPHVGDKTQTDVIRSDFGSAENLPNPMNDTLVFPIDPMSCPVMQGNAQQQGLSSQDVSVSDCLLGGQDTGEEATFILTLVEIPISDNYGYSCDSHVAESLPAPVLISSGSCQALSQNLNPSTETVSCEPCVVGQGDEDLTLDQTSLHKNTRSTDEGERTSPQKKSFVSEHVVDLQMQPTALETDGDGEDAPKVSVTEPREPAGVSQVVATAVRERPPNWPAAKACDTMPVETPEMSVTDSLSRNLPLVYAQPVTASKMPLKRPGKKPLGFLSLVCKEKQLKKANEEKQKKKALPRLTSRKISPTVHGQQKEGSDLNLENAKDNEVPSSSTLYVPAEIQSSTSGKAKELNSTSQIIEDQEPELRPPSKSRDLSTEEEAAPVSEYFFSDIFMEVDD